MFSSVMYDCAGARGLWKDDACRLGLWETTATAMPGIQANVKKYLSRCGMEKHSISGKITEAQSGKV